MTDTKINPFPIDLFKIKKFYYLLYTWSSESKDPCDPFVSTPDYIFYFSY